MFKHVGSLEDLFREIRKHMESDNQEQENDEIPQSMLEQLGCGRLKQMDEFIREIDASIGRFMSIKAAVVDDREKLLREILEHFGYEGQSASGNSADSEVTESPKAHQEPVPPWRAEKNDRAGSNPEPEGEPATKEKAKPEFKRLSKHRPTGNSRLDALEMALHDALERLNNSKMAFHFMAIKEVRLALTDLYKSWDKPEEERIAELEAGLKDAVDRLSANPNAANSKVMPEIWGDIIVALQGNKDGNQ